MRMPIGLKEKEGRIRILQMVRTYPPMRDRRKEGIRMGPGKWGKMEMEGGKGREPK